MDPHWFQCGSGSSIRLMRIRTPHFKTWNFSTFSISVGNVCPPGSGSSRTKLMRIRIQIHNTGALTGYCFESLGICSGTLLFVSPAATCLILFVCFHAVVIDITERDRTCFACFYAVGIDHLKKGDHSFCMLSCCGHGYNRRRSLVLHAFMLWS